ncbi:hypothetical protein GY12_13645 [Micrococcus luteus]|nr:hypothetical protein GY12_13645 [Micrococcus luteus]
MTSMRPRSSTGKSVCLATALAATPAVHTRVSAPNFSFSDLSFMSTRVMIPSVASPSEVLSRTSMPRSFRCSTTPTAWSSPTSGMMRPIASTSTMRTSDWDRRGSRATAVRMRCSISPTVSMPAKPPPTTTKVRARRRASASTMREAASRRSRIWLRSATASSTVFRPMPCSPRPLIGKTRVVAPAVMAMSW